MYRRARALSSKCNGRLALRRSHELGAVAVTSGDIPGPRQASRAGSTVSHGLLSGWNARLQ